MSNLVVVAIPREDDYVWKISSEKIPHMTILFLGEATQGANVAEISKFLEHASSFTLQKFWMDVEKRGVLGEDEADVLFFRKSEWNVKTINDFRTALLKNDEIRKAYDSSEQFPEWSPHLTLGYPETPAKPDNRDYPGFGSVYFDRIALWYGDYEGPTFDLKDYDQEMEVSMDGVNAGKEAVERILHFGVKGMRWGRTSKGPTSVSVSQKGKKLKTSGGTGKKASSDAVRSAKVGQTKKKSGIASVSNKDLNDYANRLQLEQRVKGLEYNQKSAPRKFIQNLLGNSGKQYANQLSGEATNVAARKTIAAAAKKAATKAAVG